jgi:spoIIIJ-associated protein
MTKELVREGKLDREATAEALRDFLRKITASAKLELTVDVHAAGSGSGTEEGEAEVFADLDGKDKEILTARGGEVLKALEHLSFRALGLDPARVAAERVLASKQPFQLNAMSSRERRIVHLALKDMKGVRTESAGTGEERHIVIHPA